MASKWSQFVTLIHAYILHITPLQYSRYSNELIIIFPSVAQIYPMQGAANLDIF